MSPRHCRTMRQLRGVSRLLWRAANYQFALPDHLAKGPAEEADHATARRPHCPCRGAPCGRPHFQEAGVNVGRTFLSAHV